jgi:ATP-dependent HslUV protease ATP-binding subunit HslU
VPDLFSAVASSATAPGRGGEAVVVDAGFVKKNLGELSRSAYLSSYVL